VREQIELINRLGAGGEDHEKRLMTEHFMLSGRYEFMFWERAYRLDSWPV